MVEIKGVAHFSIPVSGVARSTRFYTEVVGCSHLSTTPGGQMVFLDAAGTCLILSSVMRRLILYPTTMAVCIMPSPSNTASTRLT